MLPKIFMPTNNGGVYLQKVRCGKKNCRCATGEKHEAYYYFHRVDGKLKKQYIRKADLNEFVGEVDFITEFRHRIRYKTKLMKDRVKEIKAEKKARKEAGIKEEPIDWNIPRGMIEKLMKK